MKKEEYYTEDGQPIRCYKCGCENLHDRTMNGQDGHIWEFERSCTECKHKLGWWAYGAWATFHEETQLWKRLAELSDVQIWADATHVEMIHLAKECISIKKQLGVPYEASEQLLTRLTTLPL